MRGQGKCFAFWAVIAAFCIAYAAVVRGLYSYSFPARVPVRLAPGTLLVRRPVVLPVTASLPAAQPKPANLPEPRQKIAPPLDVSGPPAAKDPKIPEVPIHMASIAVLRCTFVNGSDGIVHAYGSGAIVSPSGHILTARHVIDLAYAYAATDGRQGVLGYRLTGCEVGVPASDASAPTPAQIRAINPFTQVQSLPYRAEVEFVPAELAADANDLERQFIDLAVLKITGVTRDAARSFGASLPATFVSSPLIADVLPAPGEEVISFGFPSGTPTYGSTFYLQGSVGTVEEYIAGDLFFKNEPIGIHATMETIGGRSGSPVFSRGHIVGVVSGKEDHSRKATIMSVYPLAKLIKGSGIALDGL